MPHDRPAPAPFEDDELGRSLDRYLVVGLAFMLILIAGFIGYRVREPALRRHALNEQQASYSQLGTTLFRYNCASCHGKGANGGTAPVLNSKEFLAATSNEQIRSLIGGGVPGTDMSAWSLAFGGTFTDEQLTQLTTYLRSLEPNAPSVPDWRHGKK